MGGGMGGGGPSPLSVSSGPATNDSAPLGPASASGNGTGRPNQTVIRMFNNSADMTQEFLKATETTKPKITQNLSTPSMSSNFVLDMSAINYSTSTQSGNLTLTQTVIDPTIPAPGSGFVGSTTFDIKALGPTAQPVITGGRYTYAPGNGDGGSAGTYTYFQDTFDVNGVNWAAFCDPAQNPVSTCTTFGGVRGGMGGMGGGGMGGAPGPGGGGVGAPTPAPGGGGMGGGGGGM